MSGTTLWCASTIAGWSSTAAVPLLVRTTAGRPVASPIPSAMNTPTALVVVHVHGDARVGCFQHDRERSRPRAGAHDHVGDTRAPPLVDEGRAERGRSRDRHALLSCPGGAPRPHLGFTQNRKCWGSIAATLATGHEVIAVDAPGHGTASSRARRPLADRRPAGGHRRGHVPRLLDGRPFLAAPRPGPPGAGRPLVFIGGTAGLDDPENERTRRAGRRARRRLDARPGPLPRPTGWTTRCSPPGRRRPIADERRENTVTGPRVQPRLAGAGPRTRRGPPGEARDAVLVVAGRGTTKSSPPSASAWPTRSAPTPPSPSCPRRPRGPPRARAAFLDDPPPRLASADHRGRREQQPEHELHPAGCAEHGDQRRPARSLEHAVPAAGPTRHRRRPAPPGAVPAHRTTASRGSPRRGSADVEQPRAMVAEPHRQRPLPARPCRSGCRAGC